MWGVVIPYKIIQVLSFLFPLLQADDVPLTVVSVCAMPCDADILSQSLTRVYHHNETESL